MTWQLGVSRLQNDVQQCVLGQSGSNSVGAQKPETHTGLSGTHESPTAIMAGEHRNCVPSQVQVVPTIGQSIIRGWQLPPPESDIQ